MINLKGTNLSCVSPNSYKGSLSDRTLQRTLQIRTTKSKQNLLRFEKSSAMPDSKFIIRKSRHLVKRRSEIRKLFEFNNSPRTSDLLVVGNAELKILSTNSPLFSPLASPVNKNLSFFKSKTISDQDTPCESQINKNPPKKSESLRDLRKTIPISNYFIELSENDEIEDSLQFTSKYYTKFN